MNESENNVKVKRVRLLRLYGLLVTKSDETHPLTTEEIRAELFAMGLECDRRTLYSDVEVLNEFGYEVMTVKRGNSNAYYVSDRNFTAPEALILMDAVQAASFITREKTDELVNKIGALVGSYRGEVLKKNIVEFGTPKTENKHVYYSVNEICTAIEEGKKISFRYFDYDFRRRKRYRTAEGSDKPATYVVSPHATVFSDDKFYLFCTDGRHEGIATYRVDRMEGVSALADAADKDGVTAETLAMHKRLLFGMYAGETKRVEFDVDESLLDIVYDRLVTLDCSRPRDGVVHVRAAVQFSPTFIAWCCSFGSRLKLTAPDDAVAAVRSYVADLAALYDGSPLVALRRHSVPDPASDLNE